ncbi:hypothetical protein [Algibacter sp. L1A34]|uniref:hypothetical protein n=1 Tax=Algibacter sp. L1A34 TaxID=2686365 RepID=UPI00131B99E9|nr:hypothetical protein [Algibacter sp. L1A34]
MNIYKLSFGTICIINPHLVEVIVNDEVIIDEVEVDEFHDFLLSNLDSPFSILVNKKNHYSYTFEAQKIIGNLEQVKSIAFVSKIKEGLLAFKTLSTINGKDQNAVKFFDSRADALSWIEQQ